MTTGRINQIAIFCTQGCAWFDRVRLDLVQSTPAKAPATLDDSARLDFQKSEQQRLCTFFHPRSHTSPEAAVGQVDTKKLLVISGG